MNRRSRRLPLLAAGMTIAAVCAAGDSLPKLKLHDLQGDKQNLNPYRGKLIVLNFWATWCGPCKEEMPMLVLEEEHYRDRGVVVIGVSLDKPGDEAKVRAFIDQYKVTFPVWVGGSVDDLDRWQMGPAVPATAFIDPDGNIEGRVEGELRRPALEHRLDWMLGNHQGDPPAVLENNLNPK
jgi:peroxiredoxin